MFKFALFLTLCCAQVAINEAQMGMMMKALGMEMPNMPQMPTIPKIPASIQAAMNAPKIRAQQQKRLQQQRLARMRAIQIRRLREDAKKNPYSASRRRSFSKSQIDTRTNYIQPRPQTLRKFPYSSPQYRSQRAQNSIYSPANAIRRPMSQQLVGVKPAANAYNNAPAVEDKSAVSNPYSVTVTSKPGNPYSLSRAGNSDGRTKAMMDRKTRMRMQARLRMQSKMKGAKMMEMMKKIKDQPKKQAEAMSAGCMAPTNPMLGAMMKFSSCKSPAIRMACTMDSKSCLNVGMGAMCCPYGVNKLTMDYMSYMDKMKKFMTQMENFM